MATPGMEVTTPLTSLHVAIEPIAPEKIATARSKVVGFVRAAISAVNSLKGSSHQDDREADRYNAAQQKVCACPQPQNKIPGGQGQPAGNNRSHQRRNQHRPDNYGGAIQYQTKRGDSRRKENLKPVGRVEQGCRPIEVEIYLFLPIWCDAYDCCDAVGETHASLFHSHETAFFPSKQALEQHS